MKKKTSRKKESKREETNIQKKILGHLKIIIKDTNWGCPIIFDKYFKRYGNFTKTRKIMDYEIICLSAEN